MKLQYALLIFWCITGGLWGIGTPRAFATTKQATEKAFDYESLKSLISKRNIQSIDELLHFIPPAFKHVRQRVFIYQSQSNQFASYERPRVVLFYGPLILAFTGDATQNGYGQLEVLEWKNNTWLAHQIDFHEGEKSAAKPYTTTQQPAQPQVQFHDQPTSCFQCHAGSKERKLKPQTSEELAKLSIRPIWDYYPSWPGVYGSIEDDAHFKRSQAALIEGNHFLDFIRNADKLPRYRSLRLAATEDLIRPTDVVFQRSNVNTLFSEYVQERTFTQAIEQILANPKARAYQIPLMLSLNLEFSLKEITSFLDKSAASQITESKLKMLSKEIHTINTKYYRRIYKKFDALYPTNDDGINRVEFFSELTDEDLFLKMGRFELMLNVLNLGSLKKYALNFERNSISFFDGKSQFNGFANLFISKVSENHPDLNLNWYTGKKINITEFRKPFERDLRQYCQNKILGK